MKLGITICATKKYSYAVLAQASAVQNNIKEYERIYGPVELHFILVSDGHDKMLTLENWYKDNINPCHVYHIVKDLDDNVVNYKDAAQKIIAKMRTAAFSKARALNCDYVWSLDSDVIPRGNSLHCMFNSLTFDDGYYSIASCPYPSQGGHAAPLLYGFGDEKHYIYPQIYPDEIEIPKVIQERLNSLNDEIMILQRSWEQTKDFGERARLTTLYNKIRRWNKRIEKRFPPKGNVHYLNSLGYRKRGWEPYSLGRGAIVETHWFGYGCLLLNKKSLNLVSFNGYTLGGTEDLYSYHEVLAPHGLKVAAILHCPAHHVVRFNKGENVTEYWQIFCYFETEGECEGHIRQKRIPFIEFNE
jgi:hypothetical protein